MLYSELVLSVNPKTGQGQTDMEKRKRWGEERVS